MKSSSRRLWDLALLVAFAISGYVLLDNRHADELRESARIAARWQPGKGSPRAPSNADIALLPARARFMIDAVCNQEGGSPFAARNCYAEAAAWMLQEAKEQASRRDMASLALALIAALAILTFAARRRTPKAFAESE